MSTSSAEFKGSLFPLSVLQLEDPSLSSLSNQLANKLAQAPSFFFRAPLVINIEKIADAPIDFELLKTIVEQNDFICVGICNGTITHKKQARIAGLAVLTQPKHQPESPAKTLPVSATVAPLVEVAALPTKIIKKNVRSGQQVYAKGTNLVVIGSVGNGAEVIADGDIHIYGSLRGRAIAGASGNKNATIFGQKMEAELLSIAGNYWPSESLQASSIWQQSGIVKLQQEQLVVESLLTT